MQSPTCSLSIMVARTDIPFMMHTIPHLLRTCNFPFKQRMLAVDTAPLTGDKVNRPGIGTIEQLRAYCDQLLSSGVVDTVVDFNYSDDYRQKVYRQHFGSHIKPTHNYKGYPILGTIFSIEEPAESDYLLRFDSDMLLYQAQDYSWIEEGIKLLQKYPEVMFIRPLAGPPTDDNSLKQAAQKRDPAGFDRFKTFGSRVYLIDRKRFDQLLPLPILWRPYKRKFMNWLPTSLQTASNLLTGKGKLESWEVMVSQRLQQTNYVRVNMNSPKAWTLHPI